MGTDRELEPKQSDDLEYNLLFNLYKGQPEEMMKQKEPTTDIRDLAMRCCAFICLANGWAPPAEVVVRLIALREECLRGEKDEFEIDNEPSVAEKRMKSLGFFRWLYEHGRISG